MRMDTLCPGCGAVLSENEKYCPFCGSSAVCVCPVCGNTETPDSAFCGECGTPLRAEKKKTQEKIKRSGRKLVATAAVATVLCILIGAVGLIGGGTRYCGRFLRGLGCYCTGDPVRAVMWLERVDGRWSEAIRESSASMAYKKGVRAYRKGDRPSAQSFFSVTGEIGDSELYRLLLNAHSYNYYFGEGSVARIISTLIDNWDFEDAPSALVANKYVVRGWLRGRWEDKDGDKFFAMDDDGTITFNLPREKNGRSYTVKQGILYMCEDTLDEETWTAVFELYPMSADSLSMYCYMNGKYYNLYRIGENPSGDT